MHYARAVRVDGPGPKIHTASRGDSGINTRRKGKILLPPQDCGVPVQLVHQYPNYAVEALWVSRE